MTATSWIAQWRAATERTRTADEYAVWLSQLLSHARAWSFGAHRLGCIISSVVPQSIFNLRNLSRRYLQRRAAGDRRERQAGRRRAHRQAVRGRGRPPGQRHGRAHGLSWADLIVIDSGTATTFDVVAADGAFEGGVIAPGINLSMQALHEAAAKLPRIAIQRPARNRVVGKDTVSAMQSGVFWGYIA